MPALRQVGIRVPIWIPRLLGDAEWHVVRRLKDGV